ncbi:MAG: hypothetical protein HYU51_01550 [Candidatus Rokubacteria bacterium]|nr:hypothetical protein [Candidatus Rokubacteria bacterium]
MVVSTVLFSHTRGAQYGVERFTFGVPVLFGVAGFFMRRWDLPIPPLVMGVILGPMAEQYFLTSMVTHGNDLTVFVRRPVSAVVLAIAAVMVGWVALRRWLRATPASSIAEELGAPPEPVVEPRASGAVERSPRPPRDDR